MALIKRYITYRDVRIKDIPPKLQTKFNNIRKNLITAIKDVRKKTIADIGSNKNKSPETNSIINGIKNFINPLITKINGDKKIVRIYKISKNKFGCMIQAVNHACINTMNFNIFAGKSKEGNKNLGKYILGEIKKHFEQKAIDKSWQLDIEYPSDKELLKLNNKNEKVIGVNSFEAGFDLYPDDDESEEIWNTLTNKGLIKESALSFCESFGDNDIKAILRSLADRIIDTKELSEPITNMISNEVTRKMLKKYTKNIFKFHIMLDDTKDVSTFEFVIPDLTPEFIAEFLEGKASLYQYITKTNEIVVKMTSQLFFTIKGSDDLYNFMRGMLYYYSKTLEQLCGLIRRRFVSFDKHMKYLIRETELSELLAFSLHQCVIFDKADMSDYKMFNQGIHDVQKLMKFIQAIPKNYKEPDRVKQTIIDDMHNIIEAYRESVVYSPYYKRILKLPKAVETLYNGGYDQFIEKSSWELISECIDHRISPDRNTRAIMEKFWMKKLKKIPSDLIPYIRTQMENIEDDNDKMMLASYTMGKIDLVEWYIELQTVGSNKYIVPHSISELQMIRQKLDKCFKDIMKINSSAPVNKPYIRMKYPRGYEY